MTTDALRAIVVSRCRTAEVRLHRYDNTEPGCRENTPRQFLVGQVVAWRDAAALMREVE